MDASIAPIPDARRRHAQRHWEQRVGGFTGVPQLLRQLGANPAQVLRSAGLAPEALNGTENRIAYGAWGRLLERGAEATGHPQFGLMAGRMWRLDDLGGVGEVVRNCATVGEALEALTVYQQLNSGGGLTFITRCAAIVDIGYAIYYPGIEGVDQIYDCVLAGGFNFLRELAGARWLPTEVLLPHSRPADTIHYRTLFKVTPRFDSEICALRFPAYWLDRPVEGADSRRKREAISRVAQQSTQPNLLHQVVRALRTLLLSGSSSGNDLARMLSMHRRTLNRRLRQEGTTFQSVLDEVRFEVARQMLCYSDLALDDLAAALGYAGISPFMRTFRRWSGMTPGQWRRHAQQARFDLSQATTMAPSARPSPMRLPTPQGPWPVPTENREHGDRDHAKAASPDILSRPPHAFRHGALHGNGGRHT